MQILKALKYDLEIKRTWRKLKIYLGATFSTMHVAKKRCRPLWELLILKWECPC